MRAIHEIDNLGAVFDYQPPTPEARRKHEAIREQAVVMTKTLLTCCPETADRTVAIRKLREAVMMAHQAIALQRVI